MEQNDKQDLEISKLRDEFHQVAGTHITWTIFWSVVLLIVGIFSGILGFVIREKAVAHTEIEMRITNLEKGDGTYNTRISILEERYNNIVNGIAELKVLIKEHDKGVK